MVVLGLTGSYGSGKSTVARIFAECGARVIDADRLAREAVEPGQPALEEIARAFGREVIMADGRLDRERMAQLVFADPRKRQQLERIIHPRVREAERQLIREATEELVVLDVPLLFESGMAAECDKTAVVIVSEAQRLARLALQGISAEEVQRRLQAQMPQEEKAALADFIIENSGSLEQTRHQVVCLVHTLTSFAGAKSPPKE